MCCSWLFFLYVRILLSRYSFRIDNTDHIIDVNKGNIPFEYDQVNIICPVYRTGTQEEDVEQYIIYNVSAPAEQLPLPVVHLGLWVWVLKQY